MLLDKLLQFAAKMSSKFEQEAMGRQDFLSVCFTQATCQKFLQFYHMLEDDDSRNILLKIIENSLGSFLSGKEHKLTFYSDQEWQHMAQAAKLHDCVRDSYALDIIETFVLEGYAYKDIVRVSSGDIVFDCGAYTGNTALYFSRLVGDNGHVYAFEAMPQTFSQLQNNVECLNLINVTPVQFAISNQTSQVSFSKNPNPGSRILDFGGGINIAAIAIDDYVNKNNIERVDFIKMDIEGAELKAISGASETIKKFKPKLAICVYHKANDMVTIPQAIYELNPNYKFYLKHNSNVYFETVLFCVDNPQDEQIIFKDCDNESTQLCLLWSYIKNTKNAILIQNRRHILEMADLSLSHLIKMPSSPVYETSTYSYSYYPLSNDGRLHYEFLFKSGIEVCLHFEGKYSQYVNVMREIAEKNGLNSTLEIISGQYPGLYYKFPVLPHYQSLAKIMNYLVRLSLPILYKHKLLSDTIMLDLMDREDVIFAPDSSANRAYANAFSLK